jgi:hypothetical protein
MCRRNGSLVGLTRIEYPEDKAHEIIARCDGEALAFIDRMRHALFLELTR